jgi:hypothetical protein
MAVKTIETKAIISAQDKTGATFSEVALKLKKMEGAAKSAQKGLAAATRMGESAASISSKATMAAGAALSSSGLATYAAGAATALASGAAAHAMIEAGSKRIHEALRMSASGMSMREIQDATLESAKLAKSFPSIDQTTIMHMLRNARSIVGGFGEAVNIMEPLLKLRVIAQMARPGADVTEDFDQLVKGLEIKGVTQNPKEFREYMENIAKGLNAFGDTLKPYQYYEMFKYGRQATPGLSMDYMLGVAPAIAQEMGGSSFGKASSAFNEAIVGNVMKHSALKDFASLGLIHKDDLLMTKTGEAKGLKPGAHVQGWRLAQSNPYEWIKQYLLPALAKAGVTNKEDILARIGALFQNQQAAQLVDILAAQQQRIDKDIANKNAAQGTSAAGVFQSRDPSLAWKGLKNAGEGLAAQMGESLGKALAPQMNALAQAIAGYTAKITATSQERERHPGQQTTSGRNFNRLMNSVFLNTDSDKNVGDFTQDENIKGSLNVLRSLHPRERLRAARARLARANAMEGGWNPLDRLIAGGESSIALSEIEDSAPDAKRLRELTSAHRAKLRAEGRLGHFNEYLHSIRPFNERVQHGAPLVAPGLLAFNIGGHADMSQGIGVRRGMALPGWIGSGARQPGEGPSVKLEGKADIGLKIEVSADADSVVRRVEQTIFASGNLRDDTGTTMRPGQ